MLKRVFSKTFHLPTSLLRPTVAYNFGSGWDDGGKISWTKKMSEESATNEYTNPFYNPKAAGLKKELTMMQESIKNWQETFKRKNGRKPTLEEMKKDPEIGPILQGLDKQRQAIQATIQRFRIN
jgi:hypothetical protein